MRDQICDVDAGNAEAYESALRTLYDKPARLYATLRPDQCRALDAARAGRLRILRWQSWDKPRDGWRRLPSSATASLGGMWLLEYGRTEGVWRYCVVTSHARTEHGL